MVAHYGLGGDPRQYLTACGLGPELRTWERIANLSPFTDHGQSLQALGWMDWETSLDPIEFNELMELWHIAKQREFYKLKKEAMSK